MSNLELFFPKKRKVRGSRNDRVAAQLRECLASALLQRDLPVLPGHEDESTLKTFVTITRVNVSPDLRNATVLFVTLNDELQEETLRFFELQTYHIKNLIAKKLKLRFIPDLIFKIDKSVAYSENIDKLLKSI